MPLALFMNKQIGETMKTIIAILMISLINVSAFAGPEINPADLSDIQHLLQKHGTDPTKSFWWGNAGERVTTVYAHTVNDPFTVSEIRKIDAQIEKAIQAAAAPNGTITTEIERLRQQRVGLVENAKSLGLVKKVPLPNFWSDVPASGLNRNRFQADAYARSQLKLDADTIFTGELERAPDMDKLAKIRELRAKLSLKNDISTILPATSKTAPVKQAVRRGKGGYIAIALGIGLGYAANASLTEDTNPAVEIIESKPKVEFIEANQ
jgi:hypothetical protein